MQQEPTITQTAEQKPTTSVGYSQNPKREGWRSVASTIFILALAPLIAWVMISFVFQSYEVDGPSMEQTLHDGDRLIVLKTGKTMAELTNSPYIPKRHEIVIFVKHGLAEYGTNQDRQLIKRVIGVPGDRVVVKEGKITIYNDENPGGFNPDADQNYSSTIGYTTGNVDIKIPDGEVFVAGDNRNNSLDSRVFGPISGNDIVGKLVFRLFPVNKAESF